MGVLGVLLMAYFFVSCSAQASTLQIVEWESQMWRSSELERTLEFIVYLFISQTLSELPCVYGGFTDEWMGSLPLRKLIIK